MSDRETVGYRVHAIAVMDGGRRVRLRADVTEGGELHQDARDVARNFRIEGYEDIRIVRVVRPEAPEPRLRDDDYEP